MKSKTFSPFLNYENLKGKEKVKRKEKPNKHTFYVSDLKVSFSKNYRKICKNNYNTNQNYFLILNVNLPFHLREYIYHFEILGYFNFSSNS